MAELSRSQILKDPEILGTSTSGAKIVLRDGDESNTMTLKAPDTIASDFTLTFPANDGNSGQYLQTDGNGVLSWVAAGFASPGGAEGYIQYYGSGNFTGATGVTTDGTHLTLKATGEVRFADTDSSNYVALKSPGTVDANRTYTLPAFIGSVGQVLKIASGSSSTAATLEWANDISATGTLIANGAAGAIQLSDGDNGFTSDADLSFNTTTNALTVGGSIATPYGVFSAPLNTDYAIEIFSGESIGILRLRYDGIYTTGTNVALNLSSNSGNVVLSCNPSGGAIEIASNKPLRFYDDDDSNYIGITTPSTLAADYTLTLPPTIGSADEIMAIDATGNMSFVSNYRTINFVIDGGGAVIVSGQKGHVVVDFDCQILNWTILSDVSGSIVVDIWKSTYANFPPVVGGSIAASAKPTLSSAQKNQNTTLTGWTTTITAGDILAYNVEATPATVTRVTVALRVKVL